MAVDGTFVRKWDETLVDAAAAVGKGEIFQLPDGRAGVYTGEPASSGDRIEFETSGKFTVTKTTGIVILDGGRVYWDHSANSATFKKVNDRDFYLGRAIGDAGSTATTLVVDLNVDPPYDLDLARDPFATVIVGSQALGGLSLLRRGGAHKIVLSSNNEAQKVDMLSKDGFTTAANAIIEFAVEVVSDGAGTVVDASVGVANATHATDADSITESLFLHLDANNTNINFESDDGTTEVAATDSTKDYTEGTRFEVWFDMRNPADVQVYVNGENVLPATVFNVNAAVGPWKFLVHVEKSSSTDTYEIDIDWLRVRYAEQ